MKTFNKFASPTAFTDLLFNIVMGVAFMFFFGDVISYHLGPINKGVGFYATGGGTTVALTFMLAIDIVLCVLYFKRLRLKKDWSEKNVYQKSDI